jgi:DNA-binding NarL/FixJ family response regulator
MKVFVVEDSILLRRTVVRSLESLPGIKVVGEACGEGKAFVLIRNILPDVVLADVGLASGSGLNLVKRLRALGYPGRIVMLTVQSFEAMQLACLEAGADAFHDKADGMESVFSYLSANACSEA